LLFVVANTLIVVAEADAKTEEKKTFEKKLEKSRQTSWKANMKCQLRRSLI